MNNLWNDTFNRNRNIFECTCNIDIHALKKLLGTPTKNCCIGYEYVELELVRRHKKKRIQKKWIRRYGYRTVKKEVVFEGAEVKDIKNGEIEFALAKVGTAAAKASTALAEAAEATSYFRKEIEKAIYKENIT